MKCASCGREVDRESLVFIEDDAGLCEDCAKEIENELEQDIMSRRK